MPALAPAPGIIRFACKGTLGDDLDVLNIFHLNTGLASDIPSGPDLITAAGDFVGAFQTNFVPLLGGDYFSTACTAKAVNVADGPEATFVVPTPVQGGTEGGDHPANVALVVSWKEAISYRGGHPRTYLAGIPRSSLSDPQHVTGAYRNSVQTAANAFLSEISGITWPSGWGSSNLCVVHYRRHGADLIPPHVGAILSATVDTRMDSQRRRLQS